MSGLWITKSAGGGLMKCKKFVRDRREEERIKQFYRENGLEDIAEQIQAVYVEVAEVVGVDADA